MEIRPIEIQWNDNLSIYASEAFLKSICGDYGWIGGFPGDGDGNARCVLPFTVIGKPFFRLIRFRSETIALGPLTLEEEKSFLADVVRYFRSKGADAVVPASNNALFRTCPDDAAKVPYGTYVVDLTNEENVLWDNLHSKHRNVIRNAMKKGVQICRGREHSETAYEMVKSTLKRSSMKFMAPATFRKLIEQLGEHVEVFLATYKNVVQGCAIFPFSSYSAYYLYGGSADHPETGAMNLLHWEAMKYFRGRGVKRYDFVGVRINPEAGSKQEGLMMFKQRFGGELQRGYMWKCSLRPVKGALYGIGVRIMKGGDIVDIEQKRNS